MLKKTTKKRSVFLLLVALTVIIATFGIFLDDNVIPNPTSPEDRIPEALVKSSLVSSTKQSTTSDQASEVAQHLKRGIDAVNQMNFDGTEALNDRTGRSFSSMELRDVSHFTVPCISTYMTTYMTTAEKFDRYG